LLFRLLERLVWSVPPFKKKPEMVTMGGDLQPDCLADRLLTGLGQPQVNPSAQTEREKARKKKGQREKEGQLRKKEKGQKEKKSERRS